MVKPADPAAGSAKGDKAAAPEVVVRREGAGGRQADASPTPPADPPLHVVPLPAAKPGEVVRGATGAPIAVFIRRKTGKIYVRRQFVPLFDAPVVIAHPERPFGTHVFTAMEYLPDGSTFRWNVVSLPGESHRGAISHPSIPPGAGFARNMRPSRCSIRRRRRPRNARSRASRFLRA